MSGRVWRHRPIRRGDYEIEADGAVVLFVSFQHDLVTSCPSRIRQWVEDLAAADGGTVEGTPIVNVDWSWLGWVDQADHDMYLTELHRSIEAWKGNSFEQAYLAHVNVEKAKTGIPLRRPFSLDHLIQLEQIIARTPAIVAQDLAAEGVPE